MTLVETNMLNCWKLLGGALEQVSWTLLEDVEWWFDFGICKGNWLALIMACFVFFLECLVSNTKVELTLLEGKNEELVVLINTFFACFFTFFFLLETKPVAGGEEGDESLDGVAFQSDWKPPLTTFVYCELSIIRCIYGNFHCKPRKIMVVKKEFMRFWRVNVSWSKREVGNMFVRELFERF